MNVLDQLDLPLLEGYLENLSQDVVMQMLDLYINQSTLYLAEISKAVDDESQTLWQEHCHKMKGAAGSAGLVQVHKILVAIEKSTDSWTRKRDYLDGLTQQNKTAIEAFQYWLS